MKVVMDTLLTAPAKDIGMNIQALIFANPGVTFHLRRGGADNDRIVIEAEA